MQKTTLKNGYTGYRKEVKNGAYTVYNGSASSVPCWYVDYEGIRLLERESSLSFATKKQAADMAEYFFQQYN